MSARTVKIVALSAALVVVAAASVWVWHVAKSVSGLTDAMEDGYIAKRVRVPLESLELSPADAVAGRTVDLGYATFRHPEGEYLVMEAWRGTVTIQSHNLKLVFWIPHDPQENRIEVPQLGLNETYLDYLLLAERTQPRPFWHLLVMTSRARTRYATLLMEKVVTFGAGGALRFTTPTVRGLVQIGEGDQPDQINLDKATVTVFDGDDTCGVVIFVTLQPEAEGGYEELLHPILATLEFTVDTIGTPEETQELLIDAGIPPKS